MAVLMQQLAFAPDAHVIAQTSRAILCYFGPDTACHGEMLYSKQHVMSLAV